MIGGRVNQMFWLPVMMKVEVRKHFNLSHVPDTLTTTFLLIGRNVTIKGISAVPWKKCVTTGSTWGFNNYGNLKPFEIGTTVFSFIFLSF